MKQAKFKELTFKNKEAFDKWLNENTFKTIHLKDYGQDMLTIWVHETGEILHSDFHSRIYAGLFVDTKKLAVEYYLDIWDEDKNKYVLHLGLLIDALS